MFEMMGSTRPKKLKGQRFADCPSCRVALQHVGPAPTDEAIPPCEARATPVRVELKGYETILPMPGLRYTRKGRAERLCVQ